MSKTGRTAIIFIMNIMLEIIFVTSIVSGPTFRRIFTLTETQLGIVLGAASFGILFASPMAGYNTHRNGPFNTLMMGLGSLLFGILMLLYANSFLLLLTGLTFIGVGAALISNANSTYLAEWFPHNLRRVMSLASGLWFASSAVFAPAIGAWLQFANERNMGNLGYRIPYGLSLFILLACIVLSFFFLRDNTNEQNPYAEQTRSDSFDTTRSVKTSKSRECWWIVALGIFHGMLIMVFMAWANPIAQAKYHVNELGGSIVVGVFSAGLAIGRILLSLFKPNIDERLILTISGIAGGILMGTGILASSYGMTLVTIGLAGFMGSATFPCILSLVGTRFPRSRSKTYGYMHASLAFAGLVGPPIVGVLVDAGVATHHAIMIAPISGLILAILSLTWMRLYP